MRKALSEAAKRVYGKAGNNCTGQGFLSGRRVFCSDMASEDMMNPDIFGGAEPVFVDVSDEDWGMDPEVLEIAFKRYSDVKIVIMAHLYGFPGQADAVKKICEAHDALLIEDVCESQGASVDGKKVGSFGDYSVRSFPEDIPDEQLFTGMDGGELFFCNNEKKGKSLKRKAAAFNVYTTRKKAIYERYQRRFMEDLMQLNPIGRGVIPSYQTSCMTVESSIGFTETRTERGYEYVSQHGTAAPMEILDALAVFGVRGTPLRKPLHLQQAYKNCDQITLDGSKRDYENARHNPLFVRTDVSADIFRRGICLPSDVRMTEEEQDRIIDIIFACYSRREMNREIWCAV